MRKGHKYTKRLIALSLSLILVLGLLPHTAFATTEITSENTSTGIDEDLWKTALLKGYTTYNVPRYADDSTTEYWGDLGEGEAHLQGVAVDEDMRYLYAAYSNCIGKIDMATGEVVGYIKNMGSNTHAGCMAYYDGYVYCSLAVRNSLKCYVLQIDASKMSGAMTSMEDWEDAVRVILLDDVTSDIRDTVGDSVANGKYAAYNEELGHRYASGGFDGLTFGTYPGEKDQENADIYMMLTYGTYYWGNDPARFDDEHILIRAYNTKDFLYADSKYLLQLNNDASAPDGDGWAHTGTMEYDRDCALKAAKTLFVPTGNVQWGAQNMEYDRTTGDLWLRTYGGSSGSPANGKNFMIVDGSTAPTHQEVQLGQNIDLSQITYGFVSEMDEEAKAAAEAEAKARALMYSNLTENISLSSWNTAPGTGENYEWAADQQWSADGYPMGDIPVLKCLETAYVQVVRVEDGKIKGWGESSALSYGEAFYNVGLGDWEVEWYRADDISVSNKGSYLQIHSANRATAADNWAFITAVPTGDFVAGDKFTFEMEYCSGQTGNFLVRFYGEDGNPSNAYVNMQEGRAIYTLTVPDTVQGNLTEVHIYPENPYKASSLPAESGIVRVYSTELAKKADGKLQNWRNEDLNVEEISCLEVYCDDRAAAAGNWAYISAVPTGDFAAGDTLTFEMEYCSGQTGDFLVRIYGESGSPAALYVGKQEGRATYNLTIPDSVQGNVSEVQIYPENPFKASSLPAEPGLLRLYSAELTRNYDFSLQDWYVEWYREEDISVTNQETYLEIQSADRATAAANWSFITAVPTGNFIAGDVFTFEMEYRSGQTGDFLVQIYGANDTYADVYLNMQEGKAVYTVMVPEAVQGNVSQVRIYPENPNAQGLPAEAGVVWLYSANLADEGTGGILQNWSAEDVSAESNAYLEIQYADRAATANTWAFVAATPNGSFAAGDTLTFEMEHCSGQTGNFLIRYYGEDGKQVSVYPAIKAGKATYTLTVPSSVKGNISQVRIYPENPNKASTLPTDAGVVRLYSAKLVAQPLENLSPTLIPAGDQVVLQAMTQSGSTFYYKVTAKSDANNKPVVNTTDLTGWTEFSADTTISRAPHTATTAALAYIGYEQNILVEGTNLPGGDLGLISLGNDYFYTCNGATMQLYHFDNGSRNSWTAVTSENLATFIEAEGLNNQALDTVRADLGKKIARAQKFYPSQDDYANSTWTTYTMALSNAQTVYEDTNATVEQLQEAGDSLVQAQKDLRKGLDVLLDDLNRASKLSEYMYTADSWNALQLAVTAAQTAVDNNAQQIKLDDVAADLANALDQLVHDSTIVESWGLTLGDDLAVNFRISIHEDIRETAKVAITVAGTTIMHDVADLTANEDGTYSVSTSVAAAQMADTITVQIINGEEASTAQDYSVVQYAKSILTDPQMSQYHKLVKEMLNYGAAAQVYFDYNTGNPANSGITDVGAIEIPEKADSELIVSDELDNIRFYGSTLLFRNKTAVRFYFEVTGDVSSFVFSCNGEEYEPVQKGDYYYIEIENINPQDLDESITVQVNDDMTVSYAPMNYIVRMNTKGTDSLKALLKAMYNYHLAAEDLCPDAG